MERERPEYLPPIEKPRWSFPWMTAIALTMLGLAAFGVKQHLNTQAAWNERFNKPKATLNEAPRIPVEPQHVDPIERFRSIREARERDERELKERASWRCIDHTPFRKIDGGWENVPGESC